jgi:hypothetical protein
VEAVWRIGVIVPCRSVWDSGATLHHIQQRKSHKPVPSDPRGPRVWARGSSSWMPRRHVKRVTAGEAERIRSTGAMISSSVVVWQDGPEGRKWRFVVNLSKQSKHWPKGSVRMETLPEYTLELEYGEKMVSFDIQAGYRHFRLAPQMRD